MKAVIFDRDGTLIKDPADYRVDSVEKIELFPDSISALKYLADNGYKIAIVTNQAGIAEGRINEKEFWEIQEVVLQMLAPSGIEVLKTYMNGESSDSDSQMRKPGPGMLLQAAKDFNLKLSEVYMVGDNLSDIQAGINAGCKGSILVKTATDQEVIAPQAVYSAESLTEAVKHIVAN